MMPASATRGLRDRGTQSAALRRPHSHEASACPAGDKEVAPQLLQLLASAPRAGVTILAEAVVDGQHELNIIASADDAPTVERVMAPFAQMGSLTVREASHCERVVERGFC